MRSIFLGTGFTLLAVAAAAHLVERWKRTAAGPRLGRLESFLLVEGVRVWAFVSALSLSLTLIVSVGWLLLSVFDRSVESVLGFALLLGLAASFGVAVGAAQVAVKKAQNWLARDPDDGDDGPDGDGDDGPGISDV